MQGTVLIKTAAELMDYSHGEESQVEEVCTVQSALFNVQDCLFCCGFELMCDIAVSDVFLCTTVLLHYISYTSYSKSKIKRV